MSSSNSSTCWANGSRPLAAWRWPTPAMWPRSPPSPVPPTALRKSRPCCHASSRPTRSSSPRSGTRSPARPPTGMTGPTTCSWVTCSAATSSRCGSWPSTSSPLPRCENDPTSEERSTMKALSEQLSVLSDRVKKTEDVVAAARQKNRGNLENQRDRLRTSIAERNANIEEHLAAAKGKAEASWGETRSSIQHWFTTIQAAADERRAERGIKKAERHADIAEQDAADAIDLALYVLEQAEYAVVDAALARADADELAVAG